MTVDVPIVHCSECETPYVLRFSMFLSERPNEYLFQRDCKHKTAQAVIAVETARLTCVKETQT